MKKMDHGNNVNNNNKPVDLIKDEDITIQLIWKELKKNRKEQKENNGCLMDQIGNVKQQLTMFKSDLEEGLNELTKEVTKNNKACETINYMTILWTSKLKMTNCNLRTFELTEYMLHIEYIAKKKNLILNRVKDYPKTGDEMDNILKTFIPIYV